MDVLLVTVGPRAIIRQAEFHQALVSAGAAVLSQDVAEPEPRALDAALLHRAERRLVVAAAPAGLALVLRRLRRRNELDRTETAVLPIEPVAFLARHGITPDLRVAAAIAVGGTCATVGVLKDDSGHLVVDHAEVRPWRGDQLWMRAYVDDDRLCDGDITALRVERGPAGGLRATVSDRSRLGRRRTVRLDGRAMTLACDDAAITSDGAGREQPRRKRIWWDEPEQWRLAVAGSGDATPGPAGA